MKNVLTALLFLSFSFSNYQGKDVFAKPVGQELSMNKNYKIPLSSIQKGIEIEIINLDCELLEFDMTYYGKSNPKDFVELHVKGNKFGFNKIIKLKSLSEGDKFIIENVFIKKDDIVRKIQGFTILII
jgi:hypothetical protein